MLRLKSTDSSMSRWANDSVYLFMKNSGSLELVLDFLGEDVLISEKLQRISLCHFPRGDRRIWSCISKKLSIRARSDNTIIEMSVPSTEYSLLVATNRLKTQATKLSVNLSLIVSLLLETTLQVLYIKPFCIQKSICCLIRLAD